MNAAVISAVAALGGVALGQLLARSGEYRKWLRSERHKAAAELLAAGEAMRSHLVGRIGDLYKGTVTANAGDQFLADLERLTLAAEAARTVYPATVAALAEQFEGAAHGLAGVLADVMQKEQAPEKEQAPGPSPGVRYMSARSAFTEAARHLIAPTPGSRIRAAFPAGNAARLGPGQDVSRPEAAAQN
jgi:hypothetical protein